MKQIIVKVSDSSLIEYGVEVAKAKVIENIFALLKSDKFIYYLGKRMTDAVIGIASLQTSSIGSDVMSSSEIGNYMNSFKTEINGDTISLYNDSVINTATKQISPVKRANYPLQLSLSKLIEYGFGYTGWLNTQPTPENWEYDVNEHGYKGWYYEDSAGQLHWTNGMEGRLVFLRLCWWLEENFTNIVHRYLKNNL
jgi:hypothetical protein